MAKSDKATVLARIQDLTKLVLAGAEFADIRQYAAERGWQLSERQLRRYQEMVYEKLAESTRHNRDQLLGRHLMQRRALYARAVKSSDFRAALMILKDEAELEALYPPTKIAPTSPDGTRPYAPGCMGGENQSLTRDELVIRQINAMADDDRTELQLLRQVSPQRLYAMPETFLPEQMLYVLALQHVTEQLDRAGMYFVAVWSALAGHDERSAEAIELLRISSAYLFKVGHDGWQLFGEQLELDVEYLISSNYQGLLLALANEHLLPVAPDADTLLQSMARSRDVTGTKLLTAASEAGRWRRLFRKSCGKDQFRDAS